MWIKYMLIQMVIAAGLLSNMSYLVILGKTLPKIIIKYLTYGTVSAEKMISRGLKISH